MKKNRLISVIVPVYNAENYLKKCVDSIISQTHKELEIILVDDGSTDKSGEICDDYAKKDKRVKVIHKQNGGVGSARNVGLDLANGEYVAFVDSDDYVSENAYKELSETIQKTEADIVTFAYNIINKNGLEHRGIKIKTDDINEIRYSVLMDIYPNMPWCNLYKAEIFSDIRFALNTSMEDLFTAPSLFFKAQKVVYAPKAYYYYNNTNTSSTMSKVGAKKKYFYFFGWAEHARIAKEKCPKAYPYCEYRAIRSAIAALCFNFVVRELSEDEIKRAREYLECRKNEKISSNIGLKYRLLWQSLNRKHILCKIYAKITILVQNIKIKIKRG